MTSSWVVGLGFEGKGRFTAGPGVTTDQSNVTCETSVDRYRKLSLRWHPDKNASNSREAERRFNEISIAYQILTNGN